VFPRLKVCDPSWRPKYAYEVLVARDPKQMRGPQRLQLARGVQVSGQVLTAGGLKPIAGALVQASGFGSRDLKRATDDDGRFVFCWQPGKMNLAVVGVGPALHLAAPPERQGLELKDRDVQTKIAVKVSPLADWVVSVSNPDGSPAPGAWVDVWQRDIHKVIRERTDLEGNARVWGLVEGRTPLAHVVSCDRRFAGAATFPPVFRNKARTTSLRLRPTRTGEVEMVTQDGKPLPGSISVYLKDPDGKHRHTVAFLGRTAEEVAKPFRVSCLIPGMTYAVSAYPSEHKAENRRIGFAWPIPQSGDPQKLVFRCKKERDDLVEMYRRRRMGKTADAKGSAADAKEVLWRKQDAVETELTWTALKQGLVVKNGKTNETRRFDKLMGGRRFTADSVVFGQKYVWVATDTGLFRWDRRRKTWRIEPVKGYPFSPAAGLVREGDKLKVTVTARNGSKATYERSIENRHWRPAK